MQALQEARSETRPPPAVPAFLEGGGEMGALMRAKDWSGSTLGPPHAWPQPLRTMVRLMLNTGHPMYVWWGEDHACLYNDAYRASIGAERHPVSLGRPAREVWDEIWDIIGPQIEQVRAGRGATWHVDHLVPITRHGRREEVYWTYSYSPIDDDTAPNGIGGVLVVCTETTDQVLAARRLAAERDQFGRLFAQAPTFMALLSGPEHRFEIVNPGYEALVGHRAVVGLTVAEALPEVVEQGYVDLLDAVFASGEAYRASGAAYRYQPRRDEPPHERFLDFVYQPIKDPDGRVTGIFVQGVDVTERTRAERELAEANRQKDEFLATLAHELRNPLAPIRNALELQRLAPADPGLQAQSREILERQVNHLVRLVDDLLDISRLSRGRIELTRAPVPLSSVVKAAVEMCRPGIGQRGHALEVRLPDAELVVPGDFTRLVQSVGNLLNNAAKFTPPGGRIGIHLARDGDAAVVVVRDDGIGIEAAMLDRIFEMFVQVDRSHAGMGVGLGIGLTLAHRLVALHGGQLAASSEGLGRGSEFRVVLPLA